MTMHIDIDQNDYALMRKAFKEGANCRVSESAYSVGSIVATIERKIVSSGYSREFGPDWHAEEVAIQKACDKIASLDKCILYSTLEPCGERSSRPVSCSELILSKNIPVVIFAENEPSRFVTIPKGRRLLRDNGVQILKLDGFNDSFENQNIHHFVDRGETR